MSSTYHRLIAALLLCSVAPRFKVARASPSSDAAHGEQLAGLGGCHACHTAPNGPDYAGGYAIETSFGTFYGPNLTPDPTTGIGTWSQADFFKAMRKGRAPDGHAYYPSFPYPSFGAMSDADLADIWAYLRTLPPVHQVDRPHEIKAKYRGASMLGLWRTVAWHPRKVKRSITRGHDPIQARGAYLGIAVGHCGDCHTPRNRIGQVRSKAALTGSKALPEPAPNITSTPQGIATWTIDDIITFFSFGMTPDGNFAGGEMMRIVEQGTSHLSDADRRALAIWLASVDNKR